MLVKDYYHPYFMEAIDELPFPKGRKVGINGKKLYGKVYTEYIGNVKDNLNNIVHNILASVNTQMLWNTIGKSTKRVERKKQ